MIDEILKKFNLDYNDLTASERETLQGWTEALGKNKLTIGTLKEYISSMRDAVERDLTVSKLGTKEDIFLKARLRNYMLLEAFLTSPEKAKKALEQAMAGIVSKS